MSSGGNKVEEKLQKNRKDIWSFILFLVVLIVSFGFGIYAIFVNAWVVAIWCFMAGFAFTSAFFNEKRVNLLLVENKKLKEEIRYLHAKKMR